MRKSTDPALYASLKSSAEKPIDFDLGEMAKEAGGSISNLPVRTDAFTHWLVEQQDRNIFIGKKYMSRSENDEVEAEKVGEDTVVGLSDIPTDEHMISEEGESLRTDKSEEFLNFSIVENGIRALIGRPADEIKGELETMIKNHHESLGKKDYVPVLPTNVDDMISEAKCLLLTNGG